MSPPVPVPTARRILLVDDEAGIRRTLRRILEDPAYILDEAQGVREALERLEERPFDLVLSDVRLGEENGMELLGHLRAKVPIIFMTAYGEVESAVAAMRGGAADYLTKPFRPDEVRLAVRRVLDERDLRNEVENLRARLDSGGDFEGMVGRSPAMRSLFSMIERIASADATVLLTGESGTGKELVARAIHARSPRSRGPFVAIDCAAIPETLLEAELFGHEKGAFTGAVRAKPGLIETAEGGTILLDEIGEMPLSLQVKLLRVLEERSVQRIGSTRPREVDVRILAATNRDLEEAVRTGAFREDLYYRLHVLPIHLPPLRRRREDIPFLAERFLERASARLGRRIELAPEGLAALSARDYAGNVRELENLVERLAILSPDGRIRDAGEKESMTGRGDEKGSLPDLVTAFERRLIQDALARTQGNRNQAADRLGISRQALASKIERLGINVKKNTEEPES